MLGTKRFALRHSGMWETNEGLPAQRVGRSRAAAYAPILIGAALLSSLGPPVQAQRLPLPAEEQEAVNRAIDQGVDYLKKTQRKNGIWGKGKTAHLVGYAALPGLTLLECGVPPTDPLIQRTARFLRSHAAKLDTTYELSLSILFLDRLGDPKDEKIIQTFALRLIAGQSMTGGWGYKCPVLSGPAQMDLLTALRHLAPASPQGMPDIVGAPKNMPGIAGVPNNLPAIAGPTRKPGDLTPVTQLPAGGSQGGTVTTSPPPALPGIATSRSPGASLYPPDKKDVKEQLRKPDAKDAKPGEDKPAEGKAAPPKPPKPYILPERLVILPVIQDPALHLLQDPKDKSNDLILTTTDNSNTQFAILALWTAQRHGVPMTRTLNLIVRRYLTSQNADGSWGYHYRFGGDSWIRPAPMTCVGLIGLAVGHGLANPAAGGKPVRDPRIINGLAALSRFVGQPSDRMANLPMQNLYFLWSVERAAVLYNLPKIGDKDWYRWGAQILVANQDDKGNWANGQYPGSNPIPDTCLALLFLKQANLVKDLTAKLPFTPGDLNNSLIAKLAPPPPKQSAEPVKKTILPVEPSKPSEPDNLLTKPLGGTTSGMLESGTALDSERGSGSKKKWIALSLVLFIILAGGTLFFFLVAAKRKKDEDNEKPGRLKGPKGKRKSKSLASRPEA